MNELKPAPAWVYCLIGIFSAFDWALIDKRWGVPWGLPVFVGTFAFLAGRIVGMVEVWTGRA
jgi:hypothetical protein